MMAMNGTYSFLNFRTDLSEGVLHLSNYLPPVRVVVFDANRQIEAIALDDGL